ncbi:MAG TPA: hypothetical protein VEG38_16310 [Acidimicrobiia bacterium]|nr:hypothetical protein [Acidimicrobiia bacterium]
MPSPMSAPGASASPGGEMALQHQRGFAPSPLVIDAIVDALEERVLAEIDRRGGRYQGIF